MDLGDPNFDPRQEFNNFLTWCIKCPIKDDRGTIDHIWCVRNYLTDKKRLEPHRRPLATAEEIIELCELFAACGWMCIHTNERISLTHEGEHILYEVKKDIEEAR